MTNLNLGGKIQVGDLHFEGLEIVNAKNAVVAAVRLTRAARGQAAASTQSGAGATNTSAAE